MTKANLTLRAREDLRGIWRYSARTWNEAQADAYVTQLYDRCGWLAQKPRTGQHRPDIGEGYYCFTQGRHLIFYLIRKGGIDVIGIPHKAMDILNYFDTEY